MKAIGAIVLAWKLAQKYWCPDKKPIPDAAFSELPSALITSGLAEKIDGSVYVLQTSGGGGGGTWGSITGTLSAQTDLQSALDLIDTILDPSVNPDRYFIFATDFAQNDRATLNVATSGAGAAVTSD